MLAYARLNWQGPEVSLSGSKPQSVVNHPANFEPAVAVARKLTTVVPGANPENEQVPLAVPLVIVQSIPAGTLVIVPLPLPAAATVSVGGGDDEPVLNVATTFVAALIVMVHKAVVPGQVVDEPLTVHPANELPVFGTASSVTCAFSGRFSEQVPVVPTQSIPEGLLSMVPLPTPLTVNVTPGVAPITPVSGKLYEGFAGSFVVNVRFPVTVPGGVPAAGEKVTVMTQPLLKPGGTANELMAPLQVVTTKPVGAVTLFTCRSSSPVFPNSTTPVALPSFQRKQVRTAQEGSGVTTATGAKCTLRMRLLLPSAM